MLMNAILNKKRYDKNNRSMKNPNSYQIIVILSHLLYPYCTQMGLHPFTYYST